MADEQERPERPDLDEIRVIMDLSRLGELIAAVAQKFTEIRGLEPPDYDGPEMRQLAIAGWQHCCYMSDREEFTASVNADLEKLTQEGVTQEGVSKHLPEFGGAAPLDF